MKACIRIAQAVDMSIVNEIYNYYVKRSTCTFQLEPESIDDRMLWFQSHSSKCPITVAEISGQIVGWASLSPWNSRCGYSQTVEFSVYIHHQHHRRGVGRALLGDLIERGKASGYHMLIGGACTEQLASIELQRSFGFEQVACFREVGFKFDRWLDVVYLQLQLTN